MPKSAVDLSVLSCGLILPLRSLTCSVCYSRTVFITDAFGTFRVIKFIVLVERYSVQNDSLSSFRLSNYNVGSSCCPQASILVIECCWTFWLKYFIWFSYAVAVTERLMVQGFLLHLFRPAKKWPAYLLLRRFSSIWVSLGLLSRQAYCPPFYPRLCLFKPVINPASTAKASFPLLLCVRLCWTI